MREHYKITITSYEGARHYTVTQLMRRFMAGIAALLATVFLGGFLIIVFLNGRLDSLNSELSKLKDYQAEIKAQNQGLLEEQDRLQGTVEEKVAALSLLTEELDNIETMIGISSEPEKTLYQRLDTASQTALEKRMMLTAIPSGYPLKNAKITSGYGMREHPVLHQQKLHGGIDMKAAIGTPVYATADGVVEWSGVHKSGLGTMVKLDHNFGFSTVYAHMSKTKVAVGDYVQRGELIGYTGNSGLSNAPHLHYEVRHLYRRLKPKPFMEWSLDNYDLLFTKEEKIKWDSLAKTLRNQITVPERRLLQLAQSSLATSS